MRESGLAGQQGIVSTAPRETNSGEGLGVSVLGRLEDKMRTRLVDLAIAAVMAAVATFAQITNHKSRVTSHDS